MGETIIKGKGSVVPNQIEAEMSVLLEALLEQVKGGRFEVVEWALEQALVLVRDEKNEKAAQLAIDCEAALNCVRR